MDPHPLVCPYACILGLDTPELLKNKSIYKAPQSVANFIVPLPYLGCLELVVSFSFGT